MPGRDVFSPAVPIRMKTGAMIRKPIPYLKKAIWNGDIELPSDLTKMSLMENARLPINSQRIPRTLGGSLSQRDLTASNRDIHLGW